MSERFKENLLRSKHLNLDENNEVIKKLILHQFTTQKMALSQDVFIQKMVKNACIVRETLYYHLGTKEVVFHVVTML